MNKIFIIGDLHGQIITIKEFYENYSEIENFDGSDIIITLGDLGTLYYGDERDHLFKMYLGSYPFTYYNVRGNHEQRPSILAATSLTDWVIAEEFGNIVYYEKKYPWIRYFRDDGGKYNIQGHSTLVIPGAYSVDKEVRIQNNLMWCPQEMMTVAERKNILTNLEPSYDYILAHTCPYSWKPFIQDLFTVSQTHIDNTMEKFLDKIINHSSYKHFYFGHFHDNRDIKSCNATLMCDQPLEFGKFYSDIN